MSNEVTTIGVSQNAAGGYEGASREDRAMFTWNPAVISPNAQIAADKDLADARAVDMAQNDGMALGAVSIHRDSIVGAKYVLNAKPNWKIIGASESWAEEFQEVIEERYNLLADSPANWLDASAMNTFTGLIRLGIASFVLKGEVTATAEWFDRPNRPCSTAIQLFDPIRLSNPYGEYDSQFRRKGVEIDRFGAPQNYWIRNGHPGDIAMSLDQFKWTKVPAAKPWGRQMVIHIVEQLLPHQARGIADMVSVLKNMRMTKKFNEITLQNAVINASYAAVLESELPSEMIYSALGQGNMSDVMGHYLDNLSQYMAGSKNVTVDGAKIPHLYPGSKLNLKPVGTPGGVGTEFEASLLRHTAAALGLSYEEFTRDYTKTNYSSARAGLAGTEKFMIARKKIVADKLANSIYSLVLEEELNKGNVPLPKGFKIADFYKPLMKEAFCAADWIGASRGQIDEKKETEAAILRIEAGLSTYEAEIARLGGDFRTVFRQRAREQRIKKELGLVDEPKSASKKQSGQTSRQPG